MLGRQKQGLEAKQRVRVWLQDNVVPDASPEIARLCGELGDVVDRAERAIGHQVLGHRLSLARTQELDDAVNVLRQRHLKPIAKIAAASGNTILGIDTAVRMPRGKLPMLKLAAEARAMKTCVEPHADWFVSYGRCPEFLTQLEAAVVEMERVQTLRDQALWLHAGATAALPEHLQRARELEDILDCHVSDVFRDDAAKLAEWRQAKRVQLKPGARREEIGPNVVGSVEPQVEQVEQAPLTLSVAA